MHAALIALAIVAIVGFVAGGAERKGWSAPLLLTLVGVAVSFIPALPDARIDPDLVLIGLLPPLLYSAAISTSLFDFRANRQALALLAVGLVAFSTIGVGFLARWALPGISLAAAFALGAIVAPPDAVAATAVAREAGLPRGIVSILEGESLVNDATALVALNTAVLAITKASGVSEVSIGLDFVQAAGGGVLVGLAAAFVLAMIRKRITEPVLDTTLSFAAPYVAFLPAEAIHASGVLAVVVAGLLLGHKAPVLQSASSRIAERTNWRTVQFLLENGVFLLIGLQIRVILRDLQQDDVSVVRIVLSCLAVLGAVIVLRVVWVFAATWVYRRARIERAWTYGAAAVVSWAGMRGVVTLAAAFLLPEETPHRALLRICAFAVVMGTLLIQGLSLPWLARRLRLQGPDAAEDALQAASLVTEAVKAGLERLERVRDPDDPPEIIDELQRRAERRSNSVWEKLGRSQAEVEPPAAAYRRLRLQMLDAERASILRARDSGAVDDVVLRKAMAAIDLEESIIDRVDDAVANLDQELTAPSVRAGSCAHLDAARASVVIPDDPSSCGDCLREGTRWVHLRMCLTCGVVRCCDSSVSRHATRHFHETGHPVMRSVEPGEAWRWCYVDELLA